MGTGNFVPGEPEALELRNNVASYLTYEARTPTGQRVQENIGTMLGDIPPFIPGLGMAAAGAGRAATQAGRVAAERVAQTAGRVIGKEVTNVAKVAPKAGVLLDETPLVAAKAGTGVLDEAVFAQVPAKSTKAFSSDGQKIYSELAGKPIKTVDDLTQALNSGLIKPSQLPIDYVVINGQKVIANTRTTTALTNAGVPKSQWYGVNRTGQTAYTMPSGEIKTFDNLVRDQLNKNYGDSIENARR